MHVLHGSLETGILNSGWSVVDLSGQCCLCEFDYDAALESCFLCRLVVFNLGASAQFQGNATKQCKFVTLKTVIVFKKIYFKRVISRPGKVIDINKH